MSLHLFSINGLTTQDVLLNNVYFKIKVLGIINDLVF